MELRFYYHMKLHYSQTNFTLRICYFIVLLPYEITLLSNFDMPTYWEHLVLLPYEITLLSNTYLFQYGAHKVLLPYEITLLSNIEQRVEHALHCFTTI